jgi:hypothetical protein
VPGPVEQAEGGHQAMSSNGTTGSIGRRDVHHTKPCCPSSSAEKPGHSSEQPRLVQGTAHAGQVAPVQLLPCRPERTLSRIGLRPEIRQDRVWRYRSDLDGDGLGGLAPSCPRIAGDCPGGGCRGAMKRGAL